MDENFTKFNVVFQFTWFTHNVHANHFFHYLIFPFCSPIYLWMQEVLEFSCVPKLSNNSFQNIDVKFGSISNNIVIDIPCNLKISLIQIYTIFTTLKVGIIGIKWLEFFKLSSIIMMASCCLLLFAVPWWIPWWSLFLSTQKWVEIFITLFGVYVSL